MRDWEKALQDQECTDAQKRILLFNCASVYANNGDAELAQVWCPTCAQRSSRSLQRCGTGRCCHANLTQICASARNRYAYHVTK